MKKFALSAVAAAALGFAASGAFAAVDIDAVTPVSALFASEINATAAAPVTLTNSGVTNLGAAFADIQAGLVSVVSKIGYALSQGEVRYARIEISNATFAGTPTVKSPNTNTALGLVNGGTTSVVYFSITAGTGGIPAAEQVALGGDLKITSTGSPITVAFSLYDQPSQAQAGGTTGRIVSKSATLVSFGTSYQVVVTTDSAVANVEASPTFTKFLNNPVNTANSTTVARLAALDFRLGSGGITAPAPFVPNTAAGTAITLANLLATGNSGTKLTISGDFTAAADLVDGTYTTTDALNSVYLSTGANCTTVNAVLPSALSGTAVTFNVGATATTANPNLCYKPNGTAQIAGPVSYNAVLNAVRASAAYVVASQDKGTVSTITRNGTELQAPLYQTPGGYLSRFALTNTGPVDATYKVSVKGESGNTITSNVTTGTIPAGGQVVINAADLATFSGAPRGFAVFSVNRPNTQIQGVFQLTNIASGAVTNTVMVRPGTN